MISRDTRLPPVAQVVVVGAGFAGAATAAALGKLGLGPGLILEREPIPGAHSSGRNAALAPQVEDDPVITALAVAGARRLRGMPGNPDPMLRETGALYLGDDREAAFLDGQVRTLADLGVPAHLLTPGQARARFAFLGGFQFGAALLSPTDGVIDIHGLLLRYLAEARGGGFSTVTHCEVRALLVEDGSVAGVTTSRGDVRADVVVDATGAWAGRLGRASHPLPLRPMRRHLFVSGPAPGVPADIPWVWDLADAYYFRREGAGLLLSPCDATEHPPGLPGTDPDAETLLAEKLARRAPGLGDLEIRRSWACLRTFAPDKRPVIGWDPALRGLFHVSGLGGFGASTSPAVGEIAAALIAVRDVPHVDPASVAPARLTDVAAT
jgi:D-arginine dehydrogenase